MTRKPTFLDHNRHMLRAAAACRMRVLVGSEWEAREYARLAVHEYNLAEREFGRIHDDIMRKAGVKSC